MIIKMKKYQIIKKTIRLQSMKKAVLLLSVMGGLSCGITGCGKDVPTEELVRKEQVSSSEHQTDGIEAGSYGVENEKTTPAKRTFPTLPVLREKVKEEMGDRYWPEISLSEAEFTKRTGITGDMYIEFLAEKPLMDADIDTMIIIHAREDYVGAIEQALEEYRSLLIEENQKYPQNLGKAEASRMETIENYICFVQLGADTSIVADKGADEIIAYCQEENERAIYILEQAILQ